MTQPSHISTIYSRCWLKTCDGHSFTLGYEMRQPSDYPLLERAVKDCAAAHTTSQGAHVDATFHSFWGNGNTNGFDVTYQAAPIASTFGSIIRPMTAYEMNAFAHALKNTGCISEAARIELGRAAGIATRSGGRGSP